MGLSFKKTWQIIRQAVMGFTQDDCFKYSAALSFYTLFSIAPVVMITIHIASWFMDDAVIRQTIIEEFTALMGERSAEGILVLMDTLQREDQSLFSLIVGAGILIFSATNVFIQIQTSFNNIFKVKVKEGKGIRKILLDRLISLGMILSLGFVVIISLILDALVVGLMDYISDRFSSLSIGLVGLAEYALTLVIMTSIIAALFRVLPDVFIKKKYVLRSAIITASLLIVGKFGISWYIGSHNLSDLGGAGSSVIILMLWVYYSSLILFLGAEFVRAQLSVDEVEVTPKRFAVRVKSVVISEEDDK